MKITLVSHLNRWRGAETHVIGSMSLPSSIVISFGRPSGMTWFFRKFCSFQIYVIVPVIILAPSERADSPGSATFWAAGSP